MKIGRLNRMLYKKYNQASFKQTYGSARGGVWFSR